MKQVAPEMGQEKDRIKFRGVDPNPVVDCHLI